MENVIQQISFAFTLRPQHIRSVYYRSREVRGDRPEPARSVFVAYRIRSPWKLCFVRRSFGDRVLEVLVNSLRNLILKQGKDGIDRRLRCSRFAGYTFYR